MLDSSLFVFPSDVRAHGADRLVSHAQRLGVGGLSVAVAYHRARDLCPSQPLGRLTYRYDGLFLERDQTWDGCLLVPSEQSPELRAALRELAEHPTAPPLLGWTVFLHNTSLGTAHPDVAMHNCFGDPLLANLCPANPSVVDYATHLASTVAKAGFPVVAEALSYLGFGHGHHHERAFMPFGAGDEALLGLCFCGHCSTAGRTAGADVDRVRHNIADHLDQVLDGRRPPTATADLDQLTHLTGEELPAFLEARHRIVATLASRVADVVHAEGQELIFLDLTGALLGYGDGNPSGPPAASQAWRLGIDPSAVAAVSDQYSYLGYACDDDRLITDTASYADAMGDTPLRAILRPGPPDTRDESHLSTRLQSIAEHVSAADFYLYALYPQTILAAIPEALKAASWPHG